MALKTYFVQECDTCGRNLQVRVEYLGKLVVCQHCGARFQASEPTRKHPQVPGSQSLLERADKLLEQAAQSGIHVS